MRLVPTNPRHELEPTTTPAESEIAKLAGLSHLGATMRQDFPPQTEFELDSS
jgi:hypothetical protein